MLVVIDTNVLISFVTDRNSIQQEKASVLFKNAAKLKTTLLCPQNVLTEFIYVLDKVYYLPKAQIRSMIADFITLPGVRIVHDLDLETVMKFWPENVADIGDTIVAAVCKANKNAQIATFDEKFIRSLQMVGIKTVRL